ncbi:MULTISPECIES: ATP-binding cassette domain-containing protein [Psychrobacter]|jgi:ATP-binding cassette subfamily F protein 3|uniref:ATP-binding cassette domain-containing protein n=1 Tax=Psychrobacter faecalis TaxID=180588 RepID=A0ABT9HJ14_9GAMM|nr:MULTISPECIES: ATP-binding cassette domain-containing protein [Psychrobacter]MCG3861185.1 ATP-binding cassette domain-containing protein [Psychrobacter sp. Ps5]MDP4545642.1 ATP-binding cassette domain-containing protein [Psychrobacter faecalis]OAP69238.1 ABC transporter ATP-binding protein [Psychrobacter sp. SHUES1]PKG86769.1 ABC transporter ATP-binding protein [Psychrobacter sp. Sarcosine-02u-2]WLW66409.1 ATP-binding cassette domain-containing protein [Psychrobacter sp. van23A]
MIEFKDVGVRRDGRELFAGASFQLHPGHKVGLTGNNGTGKSTLFALLLTQMGTGDTEVTLDKGEVSIPDSWQVAHMAQEVGASTQTAIDYVLSGDEQWYEINAALNDLSSVSDDQIGVLHQQFDEIDGYRTPTKAAQIMAGLGFKTSQHELPVEGFSGGWRMRLNLAKTLMSRADLMLLDEPTNHLDLDAILWLETWINAYTGLVIVISHDQAFLDATVGHILHVEQQKITLYTGNYQQFIRTRHERMAQQQQAFEKQQATKAHLDDFIRRFRAKASKAKQAQSRIKQLERMAELSPMMADNPFSFRFYEPANMSSPLIEMSNADIGYSETPLLHNANVQVTPDTRLGLLGMNGAGKSTLIKALVGEIGILSGSYRVSDTLKLGYFNQHQMDTLDAAATPMQMLRRLAGKTSDAELRSFLGSFDFRGDRIDTPSELFSGGERARLTLALIVWQRPNVLVLDEPTNHLDLQMRQALTIALQGFKGAVVLVSHDRELIANVCDELFLVHDGQIDEFDGDISDYGKWLAEKRKQENASDKNTGKKKNKKDNKKSVSRETDTGSANSQMTKPSVSQSDQINSKASTAPVNNKAAQPLISKEEQRKLAAEQRKLTAPIRREIENTEKALAKIDEKLASLETKLADTELYEESRKADLLLLLDEQTALQQQHSDNEEKLLLAMTNLEEMEARFQ